MWRSGERVLDGGPASGRDWSWDIAWTDGGIAGWPEQQKRNGRMRHAFGEEGQVLQGLRGHGEGFGFVSSVTGSHGRILEGEWGRLLQ